MIKFLSLVFFLAIANICLAQRTFLLLQHKNHNKSVYYKRGDKISFRTTASKKRITGEILDLKDSVIVFKGFVVSVNEIASLYIDEKTKWWLRYKVEQLCLMAGGGYLLLNILNGEEISPDTWIISGSLIGVGLMAKILIGNRIKIKGSTKLRIVTL
jgi:hypothetical protein